MTMPIEFETAVRKALPQIPGGAPFVLAAGSAASRDILFASAPSAHPEWTPASQWLQRQPASGPVVPLYVGMPPEADVRVGRAIPAGALAAIPRPEQLRYLSWRTSLLADVQAPDHSHAPVAPAVPAEAMVRELDALAPERLLLRSGGYDVYMASAAEIPATLTEIGRLREIAFRDAGEGTGRALDIDRFDRTYSHLFVWNRAAAEIAGAYRLRISDGDPAQLYTATLFHYAPEFLRRLGPAIELGRSFVRVEYQRGFQPLRLLWKGIGRVVAARPDCTTLFGPVSISNQYAPICRDLMVSFLEKHESLPGLAGLVRPRNAPERRPEVTADFCHDMDELSAVVSGLEPGQQGVPVLLRHYLRLGGKLLGFNVDHDFANALDGLIVVDLTRTDPVLLKRYLGE